MNKEILDAKEYYLQNKISLDELVEIVYNLGKNEVLVDLLQNTLELESDDDSLIR